MYLFVSDTSKNYALFNVVEASRQIKFKTAKPAVPDTTRPVPLRIKVLHGKIYANPAQDTVNLSAPPEFNIKFAPPREQVMQHGSYYVIVSDLSVRNEALKVSKIFDENGVNTYLGLDTVSGRYYVYTNYYQSEKAAKEEMNRLKLGGISSVRVLKY